MAHHKHHSREEIAKIEIGHTDSTPGVNWFLTLFFLLLIVAVPVLQTIREFSAIRAGKEPGRGAPQSCDVFKFLRPKRAELKAIAGADGVRGMFEAGKAMNNRILRNITTYEAELKERDVLLQWLVPRMQVPITAWLKGGNEDAYCGRDGWLFYRRDIDSLTGRGFLDPSVMKQRAATGNELKAPPQPDPLKAIVDFRDQLARRGIELIVVPAPVKPTIYPEHHSARYNGWLGEVQNVSFAAFKERLKQGNVRLFDPAPLLMHEKGGESGRALYLKTDTHWTPQAMESVAGALAGFVRQAVVLPPAVEGYAAADRAVTNVGDIAMMFKMPAEWKIFAPETVTVRQVSDGKQLWRPDPKAEILFLGDSFANIYSLEPMGWGEAAGFVEHFSLALGLPVDAICRNDAGSFATREMLAKELQRGNDRLAGKKVVVWEFAARELACGDWKMLPLTLGAKKEAGFYAPPAGKTVELRGVVRVASPSPRPGSVPYKDHISMVHLSEVEAAGDPSATGKEAVVFVWSMRNNVPTAASRYRPGDAVCLRVCRWEDVTVKYGAINRSELGDDALQMAEWNWAEPEK